MDKKLRIRFRPILVSADPDEGGFKEIDEITPEVESELKDGISIRIGTFDKALQLLTKFKARGPMDGIYLDARSAGLAELLLIELTTTLNILIQEMEMILDLHEGIKSISTITKNYIPDDLKSGGGNPKEEST